MAISPAQQHNDDGKDRATVADLRAQVRGIDNSVADLKKDFRELETKVDNQFIEGRRQSSEQLTNLEQNIRSQLTVLVQDIRETRPRGPNWGWIISGAGLAALLAGSILVPINGSLRDTKESFTSITQTFKEFEQFYAAKSDVRDQFESVAKRIKELNERVDHEVTRDEHQEFAKRIDQRDVDERTEIFRELDRIDKHVNGVDADQIKRPEILALLEAVRALVSNVNARVDSLSARQESTDKFLSSIYNQGDAFKQLSSTVEALQARLFQIYAQQTPAAIPIAPVAPLAPVAPSK